MKKIFLTTRNGALALLPTLTAALLIQACGGGDAVAEMAYGAAAGEDARPSAQGRGHRGADRGHDADPLEGAWQSAVSLRDCGSGAVLRSFNGLSVFHRGGTASATNSLPPGSTSPAFGTWKRGNAASSYTVTLRLFRFNADASFAGAQNLTRTFALAADGKSLAGTLSVQVLDPVENILQTSCGTETATRVAVN
jgi:hypothetical protein